MKYKNIFSAISLTLVMGFMLTACSEEEVVTKDIHSVGTLNDLHVYPVDFNCTIPGYQDGSSTRAVSYEWKNGATIFVRMKSGSSYTLGFVLFNSDGQQLLTFGDLPNTNGKVEECHLAYFEDSNGDYLSINLDTNCFDIYNNGKFVRSTTIPLNSDAIDITEHTALFRTNEGTYITSNNRYTMNGTLVPRTWRMRFSGDDGTTITLPKDDNDIMYWNQWTWSTTEDSQISGNAKDVTLTVENGYTPYIYGFFKNGTKNKITIENGHAIYSRDFDASNMNSNSSGVFTIPTASNYSSLGWTMTIKEEPMALKDMLEKPMTNVNANLKTDSYQTIRDAVAQSYKIEDYTTDDVWPWLYLSVSNNDNCSNLTYQGLSFDYFSCFKNDGGISVNYNFLIEKSKASNNYKTYLDNILQDFKNLNISLESHPSEYTLAYYYGNDADNNFYSVMVLEYEADRYQFYIYASYTSSSSGMVLKDMLEKPMTDVNVNLKTESYQTIRDAVAKSYKIEDYTATTDGQPWFNLSVGDNDNCSNLTYQGLPFSNFSCFKSDNGKSVSYHFLVEKSKASYNYKTYLDKILQDFKNLNILLDSHPDDDYLDRYTGYDADKNYYSVSVEEYYDKEKYLFYIYASYKSSSAVIIWQGEQSCDSFDGSSLRFSDTEGKLPTLSDATYDEMVGKKMCVDIKEVAGRDTWIKVTNGWWSEDYVKETEVKAGDTFEFEFTKRMADQCKKGGEGKDLLFVSNNGLTITKFYYKP